MAFRACFRPEEPEPDGPESISIPEGALKLPVGEERPEDFLIDL